MGPDTLIVGHGAGPRPSKALNVKICLIIAVCLTNLDQKPRHDAWAFDDLFFSLASFSSLTF